jgi:hypothetical protein
MLTETKYDKELIGADVKTRRKFLLMHWVDVCGGEFTDEEGPTRLAALRDASPQFGNFTDLGNARPISIELSKMHKEGLIDMPLHKKGYWPMPEDEELIAVRNMTQENRIKRLEEFDKELALDIRLFMEQHKASGTFLKVGWPCTADQLADNRVDEFCKHQSHIISKELSKSLGLGEFNKTGNCLLEDFSVNNARRTGSILTRVENDRMYYHIPKPESVPYYLQEIDGRELFIPAVVHESLLFAAKLNNRLLDFMNSEKARIERIFYKARCRALKGIKLEEEKT